MTRLIDAEELVEWADNWVGKIPADALCGKVRRMIVHDAVPVRHGKWIIRDNPGTGWYRVTCSECGEDVTSTAPCIGFFPNAKVSWDFCPNCGARMDAYEKQHSQETDL